MTDKNQTPEKKQDFGIERMNKALKAALETPPRKHTDEPKRGAPKSKTKKNG